jgi:hypothetical protein
MLEATLFAHRLDIHLLHKPLIDQSTHIPLLDLFGFLGQDWLISMRTAKNYFKPSLWGSPGKNWPDHAVERAADHVAGSVIRLSLVWLVLLVGSLAPVQGIIAAEPQERFLERLREEGLFDLALIYLEDLSKKPTLSAEFKSVIDLERALLYFQAANQLPLKSTERGQKLNETEAALKRFLESQPKHPRRSEARLKLGGLYQLRAQEALAIAGAVEGSRDIPEAIDFFNQAHELFENTITELAQVEAQVRGDRIDASDPAQVAFRDRVRRELREAQLLSAKSVEDRGRSRGQDNPQRKQDLEASRQMYSDLISKEQSMIGIRNYAIFYRSGVFQALEQTDDAIDGYLRIIDLEGVEVLRPLQTESMTQLIRVLGQQGKYELAAERAERWLGRLNNEEKASSEGVALQMELARTRIAWARELRNTDPENRQSSRMERSTRTELRSLLRIPGPHGDQVKQLLAELGLEREETEQNADLPKVADLGQALDEAQIRIDDADAIAVNLAIVEDRLDNSQTEPSERESLSEQRDQLGESADRKRQQALQLLRDGLQLVDRQSDDRSQLFRARLKSAYLLLKLEQYSDAIAVGEFLCRTTPGTPEGLNAASIVLFGYSELLQAEGADQRLILEQLAPFAEHLVANWPQSTEAAKASSALTQMAVMSKDWERAERYLEGLPESQSASAQRYFELGAALYDQYLRTLSDESAREEDLVELRQRSSRWLQQAADGMGQDQSELALNVAVALASLKLAENQPQAAAEILIRGQNAPLKWLESKKEQLPQLLVMDAYRTAIRVLAAQVASEGADGGSIADEMQVLVVRLQETAQKSEDTANRLPGILASIARDMKEKLSQIGQPQRRAQFAEVVLLVLAEAAKSDSFATQYWAASAMISIAEELEAQAEGRTSAEKSYGQAADLLMEMIQRAAREPQWVQPETISLQLKVLLAKASEGAGDTRTAILTYGEILDENENLLDIQIRVARVLQKLGAENPTRYDSAILGGRPNPNTGNNVFWGWGKIGQVTSRRMQDFADQFFESRFQLAVCRYQKAVGLQDKEARSAELTRAERVLMETISLYPSLGGAEDLKRYNALAKRIQKELGN